MDYKKEYKNLKARIKNAHLYAQTDSTKAVLVDILPELAESEDEMIRRKLLNLLKELLEPGGVAQDTWSMNDCEQFIAWLEKQKEQKLVDTIVDRAKSEKQRVLITESNGCANIDWDTRSLNDAELLLKISLDYIQEIIIKKSVEGSRFGGCSLRIPTRYDKHTVIEHKSGWSEEDEEKINKLLQFVQNIEDFQAIPNHYKQYKDMLKSLNPQTRWKPSDEQMEALEDAIEFLGGAKKVREGLKSLYGQLKRLKG